MTVIEFDEIEAGMKDKNGETLISHEQFKMLESFTLSNDNRLLTLGIKNGKRIIKARNYVGIIQLGNGFQLEILPKIANIEYDENKKDTKCIFLEMLRSVIGIDYKVSGAANLHILKMSIFDFFIRMFINEVSALVKSGLRCGYRIYSGNENFCKGKLVVNKQVLENHIHQERFYVEYDIFSVDRSENRLLKSALILLKKLTASEENKVSINRLLYYFDEVKISENYQADFSKCCNDRNFTHYRTALSWAKIFLMNRSFTTYSGDNQAYALLFPMEKVFESYIAHLVKKYNKKSKVLIQATGEYLSDKPKCFMLRPDIIIKKDQKDVVCIVDTKWKILNKTKENFGISQSDMYQMYAYAKKYNCSKIVLLYPETEDSLSMKNEYQIDDEITVYIRFAQLRNYRNTAEILPDEIKNI